VSAFFDALPAAADTVENVAAATAVAPAIKMLRRDPDVTSSVGFGLMTQCSLSVAGSAVPPSQSAAREACG
jgi:hypothetical protein